MMKGGLLTSMKKGDIVGRLVVIYANPSYWLWNLQLILVYGHEGKHKCKYNTHGWIVHDMPFLVIGDTLGGSSWLRRNDFLKMTMCIEEESTGQT